MTIKEKFNSIVPLVILILHCLMFLNLVSYNLCSLYFSELRSAFFLSTYLYFKNKQAYQLYLNYNVKECWGLLNKSNPGVFQGISCLCLGLYRLG